MADITQKLITAIDVVSMDMKSVDQIAPYIRDIQVALSAFPNLPHDFKGSIIIKKWLDYFQGKQAADELADSDARQLKMELERVMNHFNEDVLGKM